MYTADGTLYATVVSSAIQTRYVADVQGADHWEAQVSSGAGVEWLLSDYQGSVRQVRSLTGTLVDSITYDAYGNATDPSPGTSLVGFQGMVFDTAIGQNVTTAREYDPESGRWNRVDPIGFASGQSNLYDFVGNGPTDATDPSGLEQQWDLYSFAKPEDIQDDLDALRVIQANFSSISGSKDEDVFTKTQLQNIAATSADPKLKSARKSIRNRQQEIPNFRHF